MSEKTLSEQEWVYNYLKSRKNPVPLVIGTRGTWGKKFHLHKITILN